MQRTHLLRLGSRLAALTLAARVVSALPCPVPNQIPNFFYCN